MYCSCTIIFVSTYNLSYSTFLGYRVLHFKSLLHYCQEFIGYCRLLNDWTRKNVTIILSMNRHNKYLDLTKSRKGPVIIEERQISIIVAEKFKLIIVRGQLSFRKSYKGKVLSSKLVLSMRFSWRTIYSTSYCLKISLSSPH